MAVMNRFTPVTKSWKQMQPWVISKYCFLSEGILFERVSLLNTSFFLLPLANRAAPTSAVSVPLPSAPCSCPSHLSALTKPALAPHSQRVFSVLCHKITLCLELPHCCGQGAMSHRLLSQMGSGCSVSDTEKLLQLLSGVTFPLLGDKQTSPQTGGRRRNHLMHPHSSPFRVVVSCFPPRYWSVLRKGSSRDISIGWEISLQGPVPVIGSSSFPAQDAQASVSRDSCLPAPVKCTKALALPEFRLVPRNPLCRSLSQSQPTLCFHHAF